MHQVILQIFSPNRLKSPQADLEGYLGDLNSSLTQFLHDRGREMQARCRRGHGHRPLCKHGLIAISVYGFIQAPDIWRQRHVADYVDGLRHGFRLTCVESQLAKAIRASSDDLRFELRPFKEETLALADLSPGANQRLPQVRIDAPGKQDLDP